MGPNVHCSQVMLHQASNSENLVVQGIKWGFILTQSWGFVTNYPVINHCKYPYWFNQYFVEALTSDYCSTRTYPNHPHAFIS